MKRRQDSSPGSCAVWHRHPDGPSGLGRRLPRAAGRQLGRARLPLPHRRGAARAAPALHDRRRAHRRAGADPARHDRIGRGPARPRPSPASCSAPGSRSTPAATTSSCRTPSATASRASRRTACARAFRSTTTTTWSQAQYRLLTEHLGVRHLRLVLGNSMGGMQTWIWAQKYPDFMDVAVPMASLPTEMASRNWMMRRLHHRLDPQRSGVDERQLHQAAAQRAVRLGVLRHRHQRRQPGAVQARRRRARRPTSCSTSGSQRAVHRRRQRRPVPVGFIARLQPLAGPGAHPGRRCWRSTPPTTSAIRPSSACWSARSSA